MRPNRSGIRALVATFGCAAATLAGASDERIERLPEERQKWLEEEVVYIISDIERETFLSLESENERTSFVDAFWRRRDTNPNTPENEYQTVHYERIAYANEYLGRDTYLPGWKTDRGRFHILLGAPATKEDFSYSDAVYPAELWFYQNPELLKYRLPAFFYLLFFKRGQTGTFKLYDHTLDGPGALLTGYQQGVRGDFRNAVNDAYDALFEVSPELAHASLSYRTDEGNVSNDVRPFGTVSLLDDIRLAPMVGVDTAYAERFSADRGVVESDYLFNYAPSDGVFHVLPGPSSYYVHWAIEMAPQHVAVVRDADRGRFGSIFDASIEVVSADDPDILLLQQRAESFLDLSEDQAERGLRLPYLVSGMAPLAAGEYDVRVILRNKACPGRFDNEECRKAYTLLQSRLTVPAVQFERPALTELVLAHRLERASGEPLYRPFRFGSLMLYPNPIATYTSAENAIALCEPLNAPDGASLRYRIYERAMDGRTDASAGPRSEQSVPLGPRTEPTTQSLSLSGLDGGRYTLAIDLMAPGGEALAARRADFEITPRNAIPRPVIRGTLSKIAPEIPGSVAMILGDQQLSAGNDEGARAHFEQAVAQNPRLVPALERYAPYLLEDGAMDRVIQLLSPVYEKDQDRYLVLVPLGTALYQTGHLDKAIEVLERAVAVQRPDLSVLNTLEDAHRRAGNTERADELVEQIERLKNEP